MKDLKKDGILGSDIEKDARQQTEETQSIKNEQIK